MPPIEITAFRWVPDFAQGLVRDLRAAGRWRKRAALSGSPARAEPRPPEYFLEQPFGQVPCYRDGEVELFESGAIVQHIGETARALLPRDRQGGCGRSSGPMPR